MKISSASQIIFLLICAFAKEIAECLPTCRAGTYYTDDLSACVACPVRGRCEDQYYRAINRCKIACEKKTTSPTPGTPTTGVQEDTTASPPTTKTELQPATPPTTSEGQKPRNNRTSRGGPNVGIDFAVNTDRPDTKSSSPVFPIITAVLGTLLLCGIVLLVYKRCTRQEASSEDERIGICVRPSTPNQGPCPGERKEEIDGIKLPVSEIGEADRI